METSANIKDDMLDEDEDIEEEPEKQMTQQQKDELILKACKENNYEDATSLLLNHASPITEKDGWNPLLWAANNGNE
jgi:ankyrin repeat protein